MSGQSRDDDDDDDDAEVNAASSDFNDRCLAVKGKGKGRCSSSWEPHLRATGRHLPYGITQCYLPPDTSERAPPNPSHAGWYSIYLPPRRDGRLSWPSWLDKILPRPGVEQATFRSRVRRRTAAPPRQLPMFPLEFCGEVNHEEARVMGLSSSEDSMIVAGVVLAWYQRVTDRQTDRIYHSLCSGDVFTHSPAM